MNVITCSDSALIYKNLINSVILYGLSISTFLIPISITELTPDPVRARERAPGWITLHVYMGIIPLEISPTQSIGRI